MNKKLFCLFTCFTFLIFCSSCKNQSLPAPAYPLDIAAIEEALEVVELSWTVEKLKAWREEESVHCLYDEENRLVAIISSLHEGERRLLLIGFIQPNNDQYGIGISMPEEKCEKVIQMGIVLYGGFESKMQIYEDYRVNIDSKVHKSVKQQESLLEGVINTYEEITEWKNDIEGIHCLVRVGQPDLNLPQRYLDLIAFSNTGGYPFTL